MSMPNPKDLRRMTAPIAPPIVEPDPPRPSSGPPPDNAALQAAAAQLSQRTLAARRTPRDWTATAVRKWWTTTLARHTVGDTLAIDDMVTFMWLLDRHPHADEKRGCGIESVIVHLNAFARKAFSVRRVDGTIAEVGIFGTANKRGRTTTELLKSACRVAIKPSMFAFKDRATSTTCEHCGVDAPDGHVDHAAPTFAEIFAAWIAALPRELDVEQLEIDANFVQPPYDKWAFASDYVAEHFRAFHDARAVLRWLCPPCNLGATRRHKKSAAACTPATLHDPEGDRDVQR